MASGFTLLNHTADVKVRAHGPNFGVTLGNLVKGMLAVLYDDLTWSENSRRELAVGGPDSESRVVAFLNEILYILESEDVFPAAMTGVRVEGDRLFADIAWGRAKRRPVREIKAATYHQLLVTDTVMEVVFDL